MKVAKLEWDSNFFGYPVGIIKLESGPFDESDLKNLTSEMKLVYVTSQKEIDSDLLSCGDTKVVFGKEPVNREFPMEVVEAPVELMEEMKAIGLQSGVWSRFALDQNFKHSDFEKMYGIWVERSMKKEIAYRTLTVLIDEKPGGILTLGDDGNGVSAIGLFAVAEGHRGKGIGRKLLQAADAISFVRGDRELRVATQGKNSSACAVYEHFGFKRISETYIYNYWNEAFTVQ
ncbi:MAG: GNAT family N-acetyltransferase [Flavobacteriales bacterium]|nr:GNAT family N-acetyltransferase [Flavobacteriales bacterium]